MKLTQLTEIVKTANKKAIIKILKALGYIDCKKHKELRHLNLEPLFKGNLENTETFPDKKGKRTYEGGIFTQVKSYEQLEFIIVNINDNKNVFPIDMLIWTKEIQK